MKKIILGVVVVVGCFVQAVHAGDNLTIGVACTIPVIPGINAPLDAQATPAVQQTSITQQSSVALPAQTQNLQLTMYSAADDGSTVVETVYSR
jgi:hypothetical protein